MNIFKRFYHLKRNHNLNRSAASFFYVGFIFIFIGLYGFLDPATYSEEIRYKRAKEEYDEIDPSYDSDTTIMDAYENLQNSKESPIGDYFMYFTIGLITVFITHLILNRLDKVSAKEAQAEKFSTSENTNEKTESPSIADELTKLHELKINGVLTEEEFNEQKKRILNR